MAVAMAAVPMIIGGRQVSHRRGIASATKPDARPVSRTTSVASI
jgi:hypothetical protein